MMTLLFRLKNLSQFHPCIDLCRAARLLSTLPTVAVALTMSPPQLYGTMNADDSSFQIRCKGSHLTLSYTLEPRAVRKPPDNDSR